MDMIRLPYIRVQLASAIDYTLPPYICQSPCTEILISVLPAVVNQMMMSLKAVALSNDNVMCPLQEGIDGLVIASGAKQSPHFHAERGLLRRKLRSSQ
jgi:hypothetical protein